MGGKKKETKEEEEVNNCKPRWTRNIVYGLMVCPVHDVSFQIGASCPKYEDPANKLLPVLDKNGNFKYPPSPLLPVETIPEGFEAEKLEFTHLVVDSRRLVVNSQGVVVDFTHLVVKLSDAGLSQKKIAEKLGVCQQYVSKVLKPFKGKGISERFHNFRVKFKAITNFDALNFQEVKLNNGVSYKKIDLPDYFIYVFRKSITIVFKEHNNIVGLDVVSAQLKAFKMVEDVISRLPKEIVITDKINEVIGRHNAFVNHPSAKYDLKIYDDEGKLRIISDHSRGRFEKEAVSKEFCITDSQKIERHDKDMILKDGYTHSEAKTKIDTLIDVSLSNEKRQEYYGENLVAHVGAIKELGVGVAKMNEVLREIKSVVSPKKTSRHKSKAHRVKELKSKYGW